MEELKLERISEEDQFVCSLTNKHPYEELRDTILEVCNDQLQADQQVLTIVVDKLKAEHKIETDRRWELNIAQGKIIKDLQAEITRLEAEKKEMIERIKSSLDLHEDELGFVSISNHVPYDWWSSDIEEISKRCMLKADSLSRGEIVDPKQE